MGRDFPYIEIKRRQSPKEYRPWRCVRCTTTLLKYDPRKDLTGLLELICRRCHALNRMDDGKASLVKD